MCSQCPFSTEKWMTAFDHIQKKHQFTGKAEEILDKETCNRCGLASLRVAQGKFHESLHGIFFFLNDLVTAILSLEKYF